MQQSKRDQLHHSIYESPLPVSNYTATLPVVPDAEDEVNIVWSAKFDPKGDEAAAKKVIDGIFAAGLAEIKRKLRRVAQLC